MNAPLKKLTGEPLPTFAPGDDVDPRQSGKRRVFEKVEALPLKWPPAMKERYDLFDAWHDVAMQILHRERAGLHVAAAAKKIIIWSHGVIIASNEAIAARAGFCSEKTISREVNQYVDLGLLLSNLTWKRPAGRKFITVRSLWPSLPATLPEGIVLPETVPLSLDNSGPDLEAVSLDNSGPGGLDNSGPATIDHKKGGGDAA